MKSRRHLLRPRCFESAIDVPERGFSYHHDAKLDMRMDQTQSLSAYEVVNEWSYEALVKIFIVTVKKSFQNKLQEE